MTRACGDCSGPCKKYGPPTRHGPFIDQIIDCPACGWCGVETYETDEPPPEPVETQMEMQL